MKLHRAFTTSLILLSMSLAAIAGCEQWRSHNTGPTPMHSDVSNSDMSHSQWHASGGATTQP
jgi:hypothetical protein